MAYFLRIVIGVTDSFAWISVVSILMALFPSRVSSIMSTTESVFGIGFAIGMDLQRMKSVRGESYQLLQI